MWRILLPVLILLGSTAAADSRASHRRVAADVAPTGNLLPMKFVRNQCIEFSQVERSELADCRVSEFGEVGTIGDETYYYAIYSLVPDSGSENGDGRSGSFSADYHRARGLAVFTGKRVAHKVRLLLERASGDIGLFLYDKKPEIVRSASATILYVPIALDGTGNGNASEYYLWEHERWRHLESEAWIVDLRQRIPPEFQVRKGVWPDLRTMTAEAPLYRTGDANCCPSAGAAIVRLSIKDGQFVIIEMSIHLDHE